MSDPAELVEMRATIAHARGLFRESVHRELIALLELASPFEDAIGAVVGPSAALDSWREAAISALARAYHKS